MDLYMETKLDGLYYRSPAKPWMCGPYRTTSSYNACSFKDVKKIADPSRTDFSYEKQSNISASDSSKFKQLIQYPESLNEVLGSNKDEQIKFIKKFPYLKDILKPYYPDLVSSV